MDFLEPIYDNYNLARIMVMAKLMGESMDKSWLYLYSLLQNAAKERLDREIAGFH